MKIIIQLRTFVIVFIGLFLTVVAGLRGGNDPDYASYYDIFLSSRYSEFSSIKIEPAYFYFNKLLSLAGVPFFFVMLLMAIPAVLLKMYVIYKHGHFYFFSILIYVLTIYISFDLIAVRQGVAIAFVMLATSLWFYNRCLAITMVLFGSLFHISSLIILPVFYCMSSKWHVRIINVSFLIILVVVVLGVNINSFEIIKNIPFMPEFVIYKLEIYASYNQGGANSVKQFLVCIVAFLISKLELDNQFIKGVCFLYVIGFLFSLLLSSIGDIAFRIKWYFFWGEIFFIPYVLHLFVARSVNRNVIPFKVALFVALIIIFYLYPAINFINDISTRGNSLIL
ncbi:EpsG family protein [Aeromonas veronii]